MVWLASGCVTIPGADKDLLVFLHEGQTTRQEVILTLGQPSGTFEHEKILTYRVGHDAQQGYYVVAPRSFQSWDRVHYSLVLVFDDNGVLRTQKRVDVR